MSWDIIGNDWAVEILQHHIQSGRVHHAYLFLGPQGVGKSALALQFAQALMCERAAGSGQFCGECSHCLQVSERTDPDLYVLGPAGAAQGLKVDQVRELGRWLVLKPYRGERKIAILTDFQHASNSAANALLKTLEEPPVHVVLLLTALTAEGLLPTIASRCEQLTLRPVPAPVVAQTLLARGMPVEQAGKLAALSRGLPGVAIRWQEDQGQLERYQRSIADLIGLLGSTPSERFHFSERFRMGSGKQNELNALRSEAGEILDAWMFFWRDVLLQAFAVSQAISHQDFTDSVQEIVLQVSTEEIGISLRRIEVALEAVHQYANLQLVFESLLLELPFLEPGNAAGSR